MRVRSTSRADCRQTSATSARGSPQPGGSSTRMPGRSRSTASLADVFANARAMASAIYTFRPPPAGDKMARVTRARWLLLLLVLTAIAGCASYAPPPPRQSQTPRARCLTDPNETGTRPLFFLFCMESP